MRYFAFLFAVLLLGACAPRATVTLDPREGANAIPEDFAGFSYEISQVLPQANGMYYFRPDNKPLVALFRTLGVKSLRVGANAVDSVGGKIPAPADIDSLFAFARAAGVKVIYSVRLREGDPASAAAIATYIQKHHADTLECFAIGNEPAYYKTYAEYRAKWKSILDAMLAAAPGMKMSAPDTNPNPEWCKKLVDEFGKTPWFVMITEHDYPGGCAYKNPFDRSDPTKFAVTARQNLIPVDAKEAREKLLAPAMYKRYAEVRQGMVDAVAGTAIPYRLTETNSLWFGGLLDASDTYATALWSLDYLHWWAAHGSRGLNFHTGDNVGAGAGSTASKYTAFFTTNQGFSIRPLAYGLKMFDLGGHGKSIPVTVSADKGENVAAYATAAGEKSVAVTVINKKHGAGAGETEVALRLAKPATVVSARVMFLTAPRGDIAIKSGETLGGSPIGPNGSWSGEWKRLNVAGDVVRLRVPAASAELIEMRLR